MAFPGNGVFRDATGIGYKPGSDQTVVFPVYYPNGESGRFYEIWENARPAPETVHISEIAAWPEPEAPKQSEPDRIWDLLVLAAEASRYGGR